MAFDTPTRRAVLAGTVLTLGGGGAYYLSQSEADADAAAGHDLSPTLYASEETSALGVELAGKPIVGSPDAPVDIYYWTDFQCPFCAQFEQDTFPDLVRTVVDPGEARFVFITLARFGPDSMTSAIASRCVWEQVREDDPDAYWGWHAAVFDEQGERNSGWAGADNLREITESVPDVDADALETCLDERRFEDAVEADDAQASSFGVRGTPTFAVFDRESEAVGTLVGAQPPERFADAIEQVREA